MFTLNVLNPRNNLLIEKQNILSISSHRNFGNIALIEAQNLTLSGICTDGKVEIFKDNISLKSFDVVNNTFTLDNLDVSPKVEDLSKIAEITTDIKGWHMGDTAENLKRMIDGNVSTHGYNDYAVHPTNAKDKNIVFKYFSNFSSGEFWLYNRTQSCQWRFVNSFIVFLQNNTIVHTTTPTKSQAAIIKLKAPNNIVFNTIKVVFKGASQNFREIKIFGASTKIKLEVRHTNLENKVSIKYLNLNIRN